MMPAFINTISLNALKTSARLLEEKKILFFNEHSHFFLGKWELYLHASGGAVWLLAQG